MSIKLAAPFYDYSWKSNNLDELGFDSSEELQYWKKSSCGVQCLKMAVDGLNGTEFALKEYIQTGLEIGAYTQEYGWTHAGLVQLANHVGVESHRKERLTIQDIKKYLQDGCFIIISVKANFNTKKSFKEKILFWKKYGGHMALVVGYSEEPEGFYVHHTSRVPEYHGPNIFIPVRQFERAFTGRGVIVCR